MPILLKPLQGNPPITQLFGENPADYPLTHGHNGVDYGVPMGTPVRAAAAGLVTMAEMDLTGYGNCIRIQHADCLTIYGHLDSFAVKRDEIVSPGDLIGYSNNTGHSTGPHLHFELRLASSIQSAVDPLPYLVDSLPVAPLFRVRVLCSDGLNIRIGPGLTFSKIGILKQGAELDAQQIAGDFWLRIPQGFICGRLNGQNFITIL
jgi:hypothetical protein